MPVAVVENAAAGNRAFATLNEGLGKVLRSGAYDNSVIALSPRSGFASSGP